MTDNEKREFDENIRAKRVADTRRREEALLLEKGQNLNFQIGKERSVKDGEMESMINDAWKVLYQNLIEESLQIKDSDLGESIKAGIKLCKVMKGFRIAASAHVKDIIDELALPVELRFHERHCTYYYGNNETTKPTTEGELPTKLFFSGESFEVTVAVPQQVEAGLSLRSHGLEILVVEDEQVIF